VCVHRSTYRCKGENEDGGKCSYRLKIRSILTYRGAVDPAGVQQDKLVRALHDDCAIIATHCGAGKAFPGLTVHADALLRCVSDLNLADRSSATTKPTDVCETLVYGGRHECNISTAKHVILARVVADFAKARCVGGVTPFLFEGGNLRNTLEPMGWNITLKLRKWAAAAKLLEEEQSDLGSRANVLRSSRAKRLTSRM
jgi:hypothetical protein